MRSWLAGIPVLIFTAGAGAVTVEGKTYRTTVTVGGHRLKLVGAGLREKFFLDVYTMGAYSASGRCDARALVQADEVKYLRMDMLRDVSAEKMASTIGESLEDHTPAGAPPEIARQRQRLLSYFTEECSKGTVIELFYVPGQGTTMTQNGKRRGPPIGGKAFHAILWDVYFGSDSCCQDLKKQILATCQ